MKWYYEILTSSLRESVVFVAICAAAAIAGVMLFQMPFIDGLGFVLLIVSAGLMLVGGAMSFVSPANVKVVNVLTGSKINPRPDDYRRTRHRAALYALTGVLLFVYSLLLALVTV